MVDQFTSILLYLLRPFVSFLFSPVNVSVHWQAEQHLSEKAQHINYLQDTPTPYIPVRHNTHLHQQSNTSYMTHLHQYTLRSYTTSNPIHLHHTN